MSYSTLFSLDSRKLKNEAQVETRFVAPLLNELGYPNEFDFRWNTRSKLGFSDMDRADVVVKGIQGKRLTYRPTAM